ncbi:betaine-aldehyde dehydrogenase [Thermus sp. 2.9]|uniref:aldehyde dehydrogenase family protein n=1 Tax=Thermus sp. (strain 2.9) TaxID=1577051 RepID=UPI000542562E|nr:aldehyde dehydrogenase family protein [Thermus sp. 2.9]KHG64707.1 betaine-aldehyde dehydrogenase [Thermus sp. 2.9]
MVISLPRPAEEFLQRVGPLYIGGRFMEAQDGERFAVLNPATQEVLAFVARAKAPDVDQAVLAAERAFEGPWSRTSPDERSRLLFRLAELIEEHAEPLAVLEALNVGKPYVEARTADVPLAAQHFRYFAGWTTKWSGEVLPVSLPGNYLAYTRREPLGVIGAIIPWNFPLLIASWKLAPALAAGNTVVLKPSELTPLTALYLAELVEAAGFPKGVVNVVPGFGPEAGEALVKHPKIAKISFTGSPEVGKAILKKSADKLKRVTLELGGKSPNIVLEDADPQKVVRGVLFAAFFNQGEVCAAGSRLFVPKRRLDAFMDKLLDAVKKMRQGHPLDPGTQIGPLISDEHRKRVMMYIRQGKEEGAELLTGGKPNHSLPGFYVEPTVFFAEDHHTIAQEEIFGPVLTVLPYENLNEAIQRANATRYGLAAGVWSEDMRQAIRVAHSLKAGTVWVNGYLLLDATSPWGGFKESGLGREMGHYALEHYTEVKSIWLNLS